MDPISAGLTQKALTGMGGMGSPMPAQSTFQTDKSSFGQLLNNTITAQNNDAQTTNAKLMDFVESFTNDASMDPKMKSMAANDIQVDLSKAGEIQNSSAPKSSSIYDIFKEVNSSQMQMDQYMEKMMNGGLGHLNQQEIIGMQIFAHMNTVNMEIVSKVGEMANKAITTPYNMQVG